MLPLAALLNPVEVDREKKYPLPSPCLTHCTSSTYNSPTTSHLVVPLKQKLAKDRAIFTTGRIRGPVNFPPFEHLDTAARCEAEMFRVYPLGGIGNFSRHIPYNSDKKDFFLKTNRESFEVFQYVFKLPHDDKEYTVMWDYNIGLVRITPFFKCCKYSKTTPAKMLSLNAGLKDVTHSITGGALAAQGYWMPYSCARAVCRTFCHNVAGALIPLFGPDFPSSCVPPDSEAFGRMVIDPAITDEAFRGAQAYREQSIASSHGQELLIMDQEYQRYHQRPSLTAGGRHELRCRQLGLLKCGLKHSQDHLNYLADASYIDNVTGERLRNSIDSNSYRQHSEESLVTAGYPVAGSRIAPGTSSSISGWHKGGWHGNQLPPPRRPQRFTNRRASLQTNLPSLSSPSAWDPNWSIAASPQRLTPVASDDYEAGLHSRQLPTPPQASIPRRQLSAAEEQKQRCVDEAPPRGILANYSSDRINGCSSRRTASRSLACQHPPDQVTTSAVSDKNAAWLLLKLGVRDGEYDGRCEDATNGLDEDKAGAEGRTQAERGSETGSRGIGKDVRWSTPAKRRRTMSM